MALVPAPGRGHDLFDVDVLRLPAQRAAGQRGVGDEFWRVALAALSDHFGYRMPRHAATGLDHLPHAMPNGRSPG